MSRISLRQLVGQTAVSVSSIDLYSTLPASEQIVTFLIVSFQILEDNFVVTVLAIDRSQFAHLLVLRRIRRVAMDTSTNSVVASLYMLPEGMVVDDVLAAMALEWTDEVQVRQLGFHLWSCPFHDLALASSRAVGAPTGCLTEGVEAGPAERGLTARAARGLEHHSLAQQTHQSPRQGLSRQKVGWRHCLRK